MPIHSDKSCVIHYGDGNCSLEGSETQSVELFYSGGAIVETFANDKRWVLQGKNKIIVMSMDFTPLTFLFAYSGRLKILNAKAVNLYSEIHTTINRIENYSEILDTKAEDLTTKSEKLAATGFVIGQSPKEIKYPILEYQDTETHNGRLYLKNSREYHGKFHIHFKDGSAMTGAIHSPGSELLYYKFTLRGKFIDKLIPTTTMEAQKFLRKEKGKMRSKGSIKRFIRSIFKSRDR